MLRDDETVSFLTLNEKRAAAGSLFLGRRRRALLGGGLRRSDNKRRWTLLVAMRLRCLMPRGRLFWKKLKMHDGSPKSGMSAANAVEILAKSELKILREIIRQAESYLDSQLRTALASDQRATAFVTALSSAITVLMGATATLVISGSKYQVLSLPLVPLIVYLFSALWFATQTCKPDKFEYCGNSPDNWLEDVEANKPIERCLAEQAVHYAEMISSNDKVLSRCSDDLRKALKLLFGGLVCSGAAMVLALFFLVSAY